MALMKRHELAVHAINKEINRLKRQRDRLKEKCFSNPAQELLELHQEAKEKLEKYKTLKQRTSPEFIKWLKESAVKEKAINIRIQALVNGRDAKDHEKLSELELAISDLSHSASILSIRG